MSNTIAQIKKNFHRVKEICEHINSLLDAGFLVFNESGDRMSDKWRFEFNEPNWNELTIEHAWFDEVTLRIAENCAIGYFNPDESVKEITAFWKAWKTCPPDSFMSVIPRKEKK